MKKKTILDEVLFILFLSYICIQLLRADIPSFFLRKDCFSNIKTSSKRLQYSRCFSRNLTPRAPKNTLTVFVFYLF